MAETSLPACGSESANAAIRLPRITGGRYLRFCASVPNSEIGPVPRPCIAKQKSASPPWRASVSRESARLRTSNFPPGSVTQHWFRKPSAPSRCTISRQARSSAASSVAPCAIPASFALANSSSCSASARWRASKNGQSRNVVSGISIALEARFFLLHERFVRPLEVAGLHADRLRLAFGLERLLDRLAPFLVQALLRHRMRERRSVGQAACHLLRARKHALGRNQIVEIAPREAFFGAHRASRIQELGRAAVPDDPRQDRARTHVAAREAHANEEKRSLRVGRAVAQVARHRQDRSSAGGHAVDRGDDRLRARAHLSYEIPGHARELEQLAHFHAHQRPDDLVHVAAGAEVAALAGEDDRPHVARVLQPVERVAQLGVALERKRVLAFRAVQRDRGDAVSHLPAEMLRLPLGCLERRPTGHFSFAFCAFAARRSSVFLRSTMNRPCLQRAIASMPSCADTSNVTARPLTSVTLASIFTVMPSSVAAR